MERPMAFKVSCKDVKLFSAVIRIGVFILRFTELERGGALVLETKGRWDKSRLYGSSIRVPDELYKAAKEQAYAIRRDQERVPMR